MGLAGMIYVWASLAIIVPVWLLQQFVRGRPVGHGQMLALGMLIYVVAPFLAYQTSAYDDGPGSVLWEAAFERLASRSELALWVGGFLTVAYLLGANFPTRSSASRLDRPFGLRLLQLSWLGLAALWTVYVLLARELLFSGYLIAYRPDLMGPLANISLATLLIYLNLEQWQQSPRLRWAYGGLLALNSVVLLSMGGRLYVAATLVAVFLQHFNGATGRRPAARLAGLATLFAAVALLSLVGLWRMDGELDLGATGTLLLAEPVLTSISLGTLLDCSMIDLVAVPRNFSSSIINFIPSAVLPNKDELMVELDPGGNCLASPFGATHLGTSLLVNFGLLGSFVIVFLFALAMKLLRGRRPGWWLYHYLCSLLPFMLFRDGFLIFNKAFFATGLVLALVLLALSGRREVRPSPA